MTTSTQVVSNPAGQSLTNWADFNNVSLEGRISHAEIKSSENNEWVSVSVITTLKDGTDGVVVQFTSSNGILSLAKKGYLTKGRRVYVTGSLVGFETHYIKDDVATPLQRGRMRLADVRIKLGAKAKASA